MKYKTLAKQIVMDIEADRWPVGSKMPSLRQICQLFDVSMTTALNCYQQLEADGWLIAKARSGYYVSRPMVAERLPKLPQFESRVVSISPQKSNSLFGLDDWHSSPLGISRLADTLIPNDTLAKLFKRSTQRLGAEISSYTNPQGDEHLRHALSHHFAKYDFIAAPDEWVVTNGCLHAVRLALEVTTKPGDAVAISSPCFNGLLKLLQQMHRRIVEIPSAADGLDLDQLEHHMREQTINACLVSTSHMNPQGLVLSQDQKQRLALLASETNTPVIEDDVYVELGHRDAIPKPVKHWDRTGHVLWCGSFSKSLAPALRTGWCLPGRYKDVMIDTLNAHSFGTSPIVQRGLAEFISTGQYHRHLQKVRNQLFTQLCEYRALLLKHLPVGSAVSLPSGGMVLWIQGPEMDAKRFESLCLNDGIDIKMGHLFSTRDDYENYFRVNVGWSLDAEQQPGRTNREALLRLCDYVVECMTNDLGRTSQSA